MRTFFGTVIVLLASSVFWLTYLWFITRKDDKESLKNPNVKDNARNEQLNGVDSIHQPEQGVIKINY